LTNISLNQQISSDKRVHELVTESEHVRKRKLFRMFPIFCIILGILLVLYGGLADNGVIIGFGWVFVAVGIIVQIILHSRKSNGSEQ
jgi:hypothetical protein